MRTDSAISVFVVPRPSVRQKRRTSTDSGSPSSAHDRAAAHLLARRVRELAAFELDRQRAHDGVTSISTLSVTSGHFGISPESFSLQTMRLLPPEKECMVSAGTRTSACPEAATPPGDS